MLEQARAELAPTGVLRAGINMSNFLLVTGKTPEGEAGAAFLRDFVEEVKARGFVASLIEKHGVTGRLTVAPLTSAVRATASNMRCPRAP